MTEQYELIPTAKKRGSQPPVGWVEFAPGMNTKRRTMTEGYLNTRLSRANSIAMNQNYVKKVLGNPKTPRENRDAVIAYVFNHPEKFTPLADQTEDPVQNEWARKKNGNADHGFIREFKNSFGRVRR